MGAEPNPNIRPPVLTSVERVSTAAEVNADWKPMHDYHRHGGDAVNDAVTVRDSRNPTCRWSICGGTLSRLRRLR